MSLWLMYHDVLCKPKASSTPRVMSLIKCSNRNENEAMHSREARSWEYGIGAI